MASAGSQPGLATSARPFEADVQVESPNRNLAPITAGLDAEQRLVVGGCLLSELARTWGTPLYVLDEADFRARARAFFPGVAFMASLDDIYK